MKRQDGTQPAIDENHPYKSFQKREGIPAGERCDFGYAPAAVDRRPSSKASLVIEDDEFPPYATANIGKELCTAWKID